MGNKEKVTTHSYDRLGVSASKAGLHEALEKTGFKTSNQFFVGLSSDIAKNNHYRSFLHCDGAGTKTIIAYLLYRETGRISHFAGLAQDALVMNLDDVLCTGRPEKLLLANTILRNALLIDDNILRVILQGYQDCIELLTKFGIDIELSGGETADCPDLVRTLSVDAVLAGRIAEDKLVNCSNITHDDAIVGLASFGQSSYENEHNSGIGSNGLTLARHALLNSTYAKRYPEIIAPEVSHKNSSGSLLLYDAIPNSPHTVGGLLRSPTRTYAPILIQIFNELGSKVHGIIHNTGGGQTKVLRFGEGNMYVKDNLFEPPAIFQLIQKEGQISFYEMYQVFNMGHRLEIYLPSIYAKEVVAIANSFNIEARVIGHVEKLSDPHARNALKISSPYGDFAYHH